MKILRKFFAGISLTAAMFVFQACYGTEPVIDYRNICFKVVEAESGNPIPNVRIIAEWQSNSNSFRYGWREIGTTDSTGTCISSMEQYDLKIKFNFSDYDSIYVAKDTLLNNIYFDTLEIALRKNSK